MIEPDKGVELVPSISLEKGRTYAGLVSVLMLVSLVVNFSS